MQPPAIPHDERERQAALDAYGVLDTPPDAAFDGVVRIAAHIAGSPIALVSLVDRDRQWFKARCGLEASETSRDVSFCGHVVASGELLEVPDARDDPRFADNPLVTDAPAIRFYAGIPLRTPGGHVVGTLCVIDRVPRALDAVQRELLAVLARQVVDQLELRLANQALRQRQAALAQTQRYLELTPELFATIDADLRLRDVNPAWTAVLGWPLDELDGRSLLELFHPDDVPATQAEAARLLASNGSTVEFVNRLRSRGGGWVALAWTVVVRDGVFYGSARDVTGRLAEQARLATASNQAAELASRVHSIVASADYAIIETTPAGTIREFNPAAERMLGYAADEVIGRALPIIHARAGAEPARIALAADDDGGFAALAAAVPPGRADERLWTFVRKDGSAFPALMSLTVRRDPAGQCLGLVAIVSDRTAQQVAEARLHASEARARSIVDSAFDAIVTIDEHGRIHHANPAVERLFGHAPVDLLGRDVSVLMPEPERGRHDGYLARYLRTGEAKMIGGVRELTAARADGTTIPVDLSISEFEHDGVRYFTGVMRDISERKRVARLQAEFVSTVSHELRTPLTSIRGSLGLVAAGVTGELPPEAKEYVEIAVANSDRLIRLINDILDIEKLEAGRMDFRMVPLEVGAVIGQAIAATAAYAAAHHVRLRRLPSPVRGEVLADTDRLIQVLVNLVSNAVKFSPPDADVELTLTTAGDDLRIGVRDHGAGIPAEFRARVFERFAQADGSSTRHRGGTGLGLSIARAIVERLHGRLFFEDAPGGGTCFWVELPRHRAPSRPEFAPVATQRVLVCEHDLEVAHLLAAMLDAAGFAVDHEATSGEARRRAATAPYAAVAVDLDLPDGGGLALASELALRRAEADGPPVVVMASGGQALGQRAVGMGAVVTKPFDGRQLIAALTSAISTGAGPPPRVLHVEDDADMRRILHRSLPAGWIVVVAANLADARAALAREAFDVVLLDLTLPDGRGTELLGHVGAAKVVVFSATDLAGERPHGVVATLVKSVATPHDVTALIASLVTERAGRDTPELR